MEVVMKFEELAVQGTMDSMLSALELSLGKAAADELNVLKTSFNNFKVIVTAILALTQGIEYDEAEARFQKQQGI
jgi:hypothetical protein